MGREICPRGVDKSEVTAPDGVMALGRVGRICGIWVGAIPVDEVWGREPGRKTGRVPGWR